MDIVAAYREVGTYRGAAEICATTHKTVRRVIDRADAGDDARPVRKERARNYDAVTDLVAERVARSAGRVSAKRLLPAARTAGYEGSDRNFRRLVAEAKTWAIGNAIGHLARKKDVEELRRICADPDLGISRQMVIEALGRLRDTAAGSLLVELLADPNVTGHAARALSKVGDRSALAPLEVAAADPARTAWQRREASRAQRMIEKRLALDTPMQLSNRSPWVHKVPMTAVDDLVRAAQTAGALLVRLDAARMQDVDGVFREYVREFKIPEYFGWNWPAYDECMTELAWLPAVSYLTIIDNADHLLEHEPDEVATLVRHLEAIGGRWARAFALGPQWNDEEVPFNTILVQPP